MMNIFSLRLNSKTLYLVRLWSSRAGMSQSDFVRQVIMVHSSVEAKRLGVYKDGDEMEANGNVTDVIQK